MVLHKEVNVIMTLICVKEETLSIIICLKMLCIWLWFSFFSPKNNVNLFFTDKSKDET